MPGSTMSRNRNKKLGNSLHCLFIAEQVTESVPESPRVDKGSDSRDHCSTFYPQKILKKEIRFVRKKACDDPWPEGHPLPP